MQCVKCFKYHKVHLRSANFPFISALFAFTSADSYMKARVRSVSRRATEGLRILCGFKGKSSWRRVIVVVRLRIFVALKSKVYAEAVMDD